MKGTNKKIKMAAALSVSAILLFSTSCTKEETNGGAPSETTGEVQAITNQRTQNKIDDFVERIPAISWYNTTMDKIITFDPKNPAKNFNFSDPEPGWAYTEGIEFFFVEPGGHNLGGIRLSGSGSFGIRNGPRTGIVVAGETVMTINNTFCFSASEDAIGLDIGGFGGPNLNGISGVIGISGDFQALMNEDFSSSGAMNIFDYFNGLAYYVVYDDEANGSYDILNWLDDSNEESNDPSGDGFAWVYSFSPDSWGLYFSQSGKLDVSGGTMNFNGTYFGFELGNDDMDDDGDLHNYDYMKGDGYGNMSCD